MLRSLLIVAPIPLNETVKEATTKTAAEATNETADETTDETPKEIVKRDRD